MNNSLPFTAFYIAFEKRDAFIDELDDVICENDSYDFMYWSYFLGLI